MKGNRRTIMSLKREISHAAGVILLTSGLICNVDTLAQTQTPPPRPLVAPKAFTQPPLLGGVPASIWRFPCINHAWSRSSPGQSGIGGQSGRG